MLGSKYFPREIIISRLPKWLREKKARQNSEITREPLIKIWHTVGDGKTRTSHLAAQGQARLIGEPFKVGNALLMTPRDPEGPIEETINCRCQTVIFPLSQLPSEYLSQIEENLTEDQKQFLNTNTIPSPKPPPPERNTEPSVPPGKDTTIIGVGEKGSNVIIFYSDGIEEVRSGGTRSWRNQNPGNIIAGHFSESHGAIGRAAGFAVFPDKETGTAALSALLNGGTYQPLSLDAAIAKYAPPGGGNPTSEYQRLVRNRLNKNGSEILNTFSGSEMNELVNAIIQFEDWQVGTVRYKKFVEP